MSNSLFHLAFPIHDVEATLRFYMDGLGCTVGRRSKQAVTLGLAGHQLVAHVVPDGKRRNSTMKAKSLEKIFDEGKDVTPHLVLSKARRPGHEQRRVNVDFPNWIIESLDVQARRLGVTRQSVIKMWIAERLKEEVKKAS